MVLKMQQAVSITLKSNYNAALEMSESANKTHTSSAFDFRNISGGGGFRHPNSKELELSLK